MSVNRYYIDTTGRGYVATMSRERENGITVFHAFMQPCGAQECGRGFLSIETHPYESAAAGAYAAAIMHGCSRYSAKQNEKALREFDGFILRYFEQRGIAASRRSASELAAMGARYEV